MALWVTTYTMWGQVLFLFSFIFYLSFCAKEDFFLIF